MKFTSAALFLTLFGAIKAQTTGYQFKENYPTGPGPLVPKPEWLELISGANITNSPVLRENQEPDSDAYCNWSFNECLGESLYQCPRGDWGLTFDDGPSDVSPILYDFLKSTNQKATLFLLGENIVKFPELVKRAFDDGHEIAIHTWTHTAMTTLTNAQIVAELKWTELVIKEITGFSPRFFRPPYGDIDNRVRDIGKALGFVSVIWNEDTHDWQLVESSGATDAVVDAQYAEWVAEASNATVGGLALQHDIYRPTVDSAIKNLPALQAVYKVTTVGDCVGQPSYKEGAAAPIPSPVPSSSVTTTSAPTSTVSPSPTNQGLAGNVDNTSTADQMTPSMKVLAISVLSLGLYFL
ncbi:hypothetical protein BDB01DRAFT_785885 [Pilobolus umbonatus]|nr:hypothetical protein BDB01DRAFT_785885 [Pilobolus umbonatus]